MEEKNKKIAITMGLTDNIAFAVGVVLFSLKDNQPETPYDLIIYENDLSDKNKSLLNQIHPCIFKKFDISLVTDNFPRISKMAFSRYENFSLLKIYSTVIWLDADILIKGSISGLMRKFPSGIAMFKHPDTPLGGGLKDEIKGYDLKRDAFASGSLVLSDTLENPEKIKEWCYKKTNEWSKIISGDMQILNLMLQEFNLTPYELPEKYCCHPTREKKDSVIIHPWWRKKFWNDTINPQWDHYYKEWKKMGGDGPKLPHLIKRYIKCKLWKMKRK